MPEETLEPAAAICTTIRAVCIPAKMVCLTVTAHRHVAKCSRSQLARAELLALFTSTFRSVANVCGIPFVGVVLRHGRAGIRPGTPFV
jgi:hypothetical protein